MKPDSNSIIGGLIFIIFLLFGAYNYTLNNSQESLYNVNRSPAAVKIAILDTGYKVGSTTLKLCPTGHYDFESNTTKIAVSTMYPNHGTMVAAIIAETLKDVDYCAIIYQIHAGRNISSRDVARAAKMALKEKVSAVNLSFSGNEFSFEEADSLADLEIHNVKIFAVAGNNKTDLDNKCNVYPACYNLNYNFVVVGAETSPGVKADYTNYGKKRVTKWYSGDILWNGIRDAGTSYAAPRALSDYVLSLFSVRHVAVRRQMTAPQQ